MRATVTVALLVLVHAAPILVQTPFNTLKEQATPKIAVFYRMSDPQAKHVLGQVSKAARVSYHFKRIIC